MHPSISSTLFPVFASHCTVPFKNPIRLSTFIYSCHMTNPALHFDTHDFDERSTHYKEIASFHCRYAVTCWDSPCVVPWLAKTLSNPSLRQPLYSLFCFRIIEQWKWRALLLQAVAFFLLEKMSWNMMVWAIHPSTQMWFICIVCAKCLL